MWNQVDSDEGNDTLVAKALNMHDVVYGDALKWTPKLGPEAKLGFRASARCEKEQSHESATQTLQWSLQGQGRPGSEKSDRFKVEAGRLGADWVTGS